MFRCRCTVFVCGDVVTSVVKPGVLFTHNPMSSVFYSWLPLNLWRAYVCLIWILFIFYFFGWARVILPGNILLSSCVILCNFLNCYWVRRQHLLCSWCAQTQIPSQDPRNTYLYIFENKKSDFRSKKILFQLHNWATMYDRLSRLHMFCCGIFCLGIFFQDGGHLNW